MSAELKTLKIYIKSTNTKFYENLSRERRSIPCGHTDGQTQTDKTKLMVAFPQFCERV
jgi:phosphoribosylformylglycinamidine (FGAM) synthase-like amidotransferase family enzyme